jgi:hypothetical protein
LLASEEARERWSARLATVLERALPGLFPT